MTRSYKLGLLGAVIVSVLAAYIYALFHGYLDRGQFVILKYRRSPTNEVAMLARRSDNRALGGLEFFVLTGNHVFSPAELRFALHTNAIVFDAGNDCLRLHWDGPRKLVITCVGSVVTKDQINFQTQRSGDVSVIYKNIVVRRKSTVLQDVLSGESVVVAIWFVNEEDANAPDVVSRRRIPDPSSAWGTGALYLEDSPERDATAVDSV